LFIDKLPIFRAQANKIRQACFFLFSSSFFYYNHDLVKLIYIAIVVLISIFTYLISRIDVSLSGDPSQLKKAVSYSEYFFLLFTALIIYSLFSRNKNNNIILLSGFSLC